MAYKTLSLEEVEEILKDVFKSSERPSNLVVFRWCKKYGPVRDDNYGVNVCDLEDCESCSSIRKALKEWLDNWDVKYQK